MIACFAVFPDEVNRAVAVFNELEDAMEWGLQRYGDGAFRIRYVQVMKVEGTEGGGRAT